MRDQVCLNFDTFNHLLSLALNNCQKNSSSPSPKFVIRQINDHQEKYTDPFGQIKITFMNNSNNTIYIIFENEKVPEVKIHSNEHKMIQINSNQLPLSFKINCEALTSGENITKDEKIYENNFTISGLTKDTKFVIEPIEKNEIKERK